MNEYMVTTSSGDYFTITTTLSLEKYLDFIAKNTKADRFFIYENRAIRYSHIESVYKINKEN